MGGACSPARQYKGHLRMGWRRLLVHSDNLTILQHYYCPCRLLVGSVSICHLQHHQTLLPVFPNDLPGISSSENNDAAAL